MSAVDENVGENEHEDLPAALERALVRELLLQWRQLNASFFKGALRPPGIELTVARSLLGRWSRGTRTLEISRPLVLTRPWGAVVEVLKHEMAHQYVDEVLGEHEETAHGPAFQAACRRLHIDAAAAGVPEVATTEGSEEQRVVERIARLLALAESPNVHEAEAATLAARRLMLKYNLEARAGASPQAYSFRQLGRPNGRVGESDRILAGLLGRHFLVEVIWVPAYRPRDGKRGSVLEICGTTSNLAIAEYVHAYLTHASEEAWREHQLRTRLRSNRDRRTFLAGVMAGFDEKLRRDEQKHASEGLVWVKDGNLDGYFRGRHPHVRHVRFAGTRRTEAFSHGKDAGKKIVIRRGVPGAAEAGCLGSAPRQLPPRS